MTKSKSAYSVPGKIGKIERHIIVVWVDNEAGVLARIAGLFSGRGYNIESLAVAEVDKKKHISRITIVTEGTPQVIEQINLQLKKLVPVHKVADFKRGQCPGLHVSIHDLSKHGCGGFPSPSQDWLADGALGC